MVQFSVCVCVCVWSWLISWMDDLTVGLLCVESSSMCCCLKIISCRSICFSGKKSSKAFCCWELHFTFSNTKMGRQILLSSATGLLEHCSSVPETSCFYPVCRGPSRKNTFKIYRVSCVSPSLNQLAHVQQLSFPSVST